MAGEVWGGVTLLRYPKDFHRRFETCIFCGAAADSKEHILPKWIHRRLRPIENAKAPYIFEHPDGTEELVVPVASSPITTFTSSSVCKSCNNKWMGTIVNHAKPLTERLMDDGFKGTLSAEERAALIKQFSVIAAVADVENTSVGAALVQTERTSLMKGMTLSNFALWLGRYFEFCRNPEMTFAFMRAREVTFGGERELILFKRQSIVLGRLVVVTEIGNPNVISFQARPQGLRRVQLEATLNWPPGRLITAQDFMGLSLKDPVTGYYPIGYPYGKLNDMKGGGPR